eukprot:CAMPEP_0183513562 /NCGR_PEP_ID=MMETSP0371-20130417/12290_1 /TAXON_ID=268820 /ORGANISM="Peridinium aciculiferum, Strain PAER-2" /LENGTH=74 /DNA_ID=CAMNT_0025710819 /DNA_START=14 /DNA_END=238 /DNA_ORIENTATION=+
MRVAELELDLSWGLKPMLAKQSRIKRVRTATSGVGETVSKARARLVVGFETHASEAEEGSVGPCGPWTQNSTVL